MQNFVKITKIIFEMKETAKTNAEIAREEIRRLVEKYEDLTREGKVRLYNEEMTKKDFILPFFRALGWNTEDSREVSAEEKVSKGRVDYCFRINGIPKFFLEAKALKEDLDKSEFIEQAINYAWHKGCIWAVLTDFESLKIFNAEWKTASLSQSLLKEIPYTQYLDRLDEIWLLSRESFEQGLIDREAERWGKRTKKTSVDKQLLADFTRFRELLSKNITKLNEGKNLSEDELDESVQRILDRLIFIRSCEDRELEPKNLIASCREWQSKGKGQLIIGLRKIFEYFDERYNSAIFARHLCDDLDIDNNILYEIIEGLYYTKDKSVYYDFSAIEADVLGSIYEQYLGHLLRKTEKRAKVKESHAHRKEQGIYYTPTYIVDYIVRNTLGEVLKDKKREEVKKIRVLDPACGSGSFLIKVFDVLSEYYAEHEKRCSDKQTNMISPKAEILKNNIFGVDLDKQAVEIAQLNLFLKVAEKGTLLPRLENNIKCGNSLIDNPLIAGDKAFKWEEEFKEIMQEGGFDVVVGNPPYVRVDALREEDKAFWKNKFFSCYGKYDIYYLFIESAFFWLKEGGVCGFIVPNKFCAASSAKRLREIIVNNSRCGTIVSVSRLEVFKDAANYPVCLILRKEKSFKGIRIYSASKLEDFHKQNFCGYYLLKKNLKALPSQVFPLNISQEHFNLVMRLLKENEKLFYYLKISEGLRIPSQLENKGASFFEIVKQFQLERYKLCYKGSYLSKSNLRKVISPFSERYENIFKDKILIAEDALTITATIDDRGRIPQGGIYFGTSVRENMPLKYLLALLNSKLLSFSYKVLFSGMHMGGGYLRYRTEFLEQLPIRVASQNSLSTLVSLVDKMLSLNERLNEIGDKMTDERAKIEKEIKKTDDEIDELVYEIYGITEKEKKIIEESLAER